MIHDKFIRLGFIISILGCFTLSTTPSYAQVQAQFSADHLTGCGQQSVQFIDESTGNPTTWQWDFGNGAPVNSVQNPAITYTQPGTYTVTLTVSNGVSTSSVSKEIKIYEIPQVDFTLDPPSGCYPLPVQFTDNSTPGTGQITSWTWDFGDGTQFSDQANPTHSYDSAGTFDVKLTVKNSAGCEASSPIRKVITNKGVTVDFTADKTFTCSAPATVNFAASSSGAGNITYEWDYGDGATGTGKNSSHTYTKKGKFGVTLTAVVGGGGCQDQVIKQDYIYVGNYTSDFEIPQGCANVPLTFKNSSTPTPVSAIWDFGDGGNATSINGKHTYKAAGTYSVTLTNDFGGCQQTIKKTFTTFPSPKAAFTTNQQQYCGIPANVSFQNQSSGGISWKWKFGDGGSSDVEQPQHIYKAKGSYDVTLIATSDNGCVDSVLSTDFIYVDAPNIDFKASPGFGCVGMKSTFSIPDAADIASYEWDFGDGTTSTAPNPTHQFSSEGTMTVTLTVVTKSGCTFTKSKSNYIHIGTKPKADFKADPLITCLDQPIQFTDLSTKADTWDWIFPNDISTDTGQNPLHKFHKLGQHDVILVVSNNGCQDSAIKLGYITVQPPEAGFVSNLVSCNDPYTYHFKDTSSGVVTRTWDFGDGQTYHSKELDYTFKSSGGKKVVLTVSNGTCESTYTGWVGVAKENPALTVSDNMICHGSKVTLSIGAFNIAQYVKSIKWYDGGGNSVETTNIQKDGNQYQFTYKDNGTYTPAVKLTYNTGCTDSAAGASVTVQGPTAGYQVSQNILCQGTSVSFTGDSKTNPPGASLNQWEWNFGDGSEETTTSKTISHSFLKSGTFKVKLKVTDANGCTDLTSGTQIVEVTVNPSVASFEALDTTVCPGTPVQWKNNSEGHIQQYLWKFGDNTTSTDAVPLQSYPQEGNYSVSLNIKTDKGCMDSMTRTNYITVGSPIAIMRDSSDVKICRIFKDTAVNLSKNADNILWDFGDGSTSLFDTAYHIYNIPGTYVQRLIVNGYSPGCQIVTEKTVTIAGPVGTPKVIDSAGCAPHLVTFDAEKVERAVTYQWFFGDGLISPPSSNGKATHTYKTEGIFHPTLKLTDDTGCYVIVPFNDTLTVISDSIGLQPAYTWPDVCDSNSVAFDADGIIFSVDSLGKQADYFWDFNDPANPGQGNSNKEKPTYRYPASGTYNALLKVTTAYGCMKAIPFKVNIPDSVALAVTASVDPASICYGNTVQLRASSNIGERYAWSPNSDLNDPASDAPVAIPTDNTTYQVIAYSKGDCQSDTASVDVVVRSLPKVDAGPDITATTGSVVQLVAQGSSDVVQWSWSPSDYLSCISCNNPTSTPTENMVYTVTAANGFGCKSSDTVKVNLVCDKGKVFIPNTFSPNGDGNNDIFYPRGMGVKKVIYFRVYNRFGQVVYERRDFQLNDSSVGWDGTFKGEKLNPGGFVYVTSMICDNDKVFELSGNVTLLR